MASGKSAPSGDLASAVSAEIRAALGRKRMTAAQLSDETGLSKNYISKRLNDQMPFNLNDLQRIGEALGIHADAFIASAVNVLTRETSTHGL